MWSVVGSEFLVCSVVGGFYGRCFVFLLVGGRFLFLRMVGGRWSVVGVLISIYGRWSVAHGRWSVVDGWSVGGGFVLRQPSGQSVGLLIMGSRVPIRLEPFLLMSKSSMFSQIPQKILSQEGIAALRNN